MSMPAADPRLPQRQAADGRASVWVAASAGTGKTKVLTDRLLNLLLRGAAPNRLLCLTFTKAAAAEMANRLNDRLSRWAVLGEARLDAEIQDILGENTDEARRDRARQLFARVLDSPGGMRILTIHAFCQSVLRRFPLEAGIPPQFEVMDDRSAAELLAETQARLIARARAEGGVLADALATVTGHAGEEKFADLMQAVTSARGEIEALLAAAGGFDAYEARLYRRLGADPAGTAERLIAAACADEAFAGATLRAAAEALLGSTRKSDTERGEALAVWLAASEAERAGDFFGYCDLFFTESGRGAARKTLATQEVLKRCPGIREALEEEGARLDLCRQKLAVQAVAACSAALMRLAADYLAAYRAEKRQRILLDYDDLILATRELLSRPGVAAWVLFKLDGGLDHILIDEAQDTNPDQWAVVEALAAEFFSGEGANPADPRTVFAVGDAKQSIFSFQRADPQAFLDMNRHFAAEVQAVRGLWRDVPLQVSFRSTASVLRAVDTVFADETARAGVALDGGEIVHLPFRAGQAGRVEIWPTLDAEKVEKSEAWTPPLHQRRQEAPSARLAHLIAARIQSWLASGEVLAARGRPMRAGDVLILVRRRGPFVAEMTRALKQRGVPVAGADRIVLTEQLAVMDLIALGRALLLPEDDLTLATVLKSPLIGFDEDRLYALAAERDGGLWDALRRAAERDGVMKAAYERLAGLAARADFVRPHELYAELLGSGGGRERLLSRLGQEAADAIDEFLAQSLDYERSHVPSLEGFLHWLETGAAEIKRDLDQGGRDEVRIMTVHGSKGLQAPVVFLPDSTAAPNKAPTLLWTRKKGAPDLLLWRAGARRNEPRNEPVSEAALAEALRKQGEEYRRLLYVALTRAEDRLYLCGWRGLRDAGKGSSWYDLAAAALGRIARREPIEPPPGFEPFAEPGLVLDDPQEAAPADPKPAAASRLGAEGTLPDFAGRPAPAEEAPPRPLMASRPDEVEPPSASPLATDSSARRFQRGLLLHRLMQSLPDLPPGEREAAARRYLARPIHDLDEAEQAALAAETLAVLEHPEFAALFAPGSQAEVPVVGLVGGRALSGRIDRLAVTPDSVLVVDYKTNRPPPRDAAGVAPAYRQQLAAYRAALAEIYPGRRIRTLLLWTDGPRLMEIDEAAIKPPAAGQPCHNGEKTGGALP